MAPPPITILHRIRIPAPHTHLVHVETTLSGALGPEVVLRRTAYDLDAAARTMRTAAADYPGLAEFLAENVLAVPSDAEALAVFSGSG